MGAGGLTKYPQNHFMVLTTFQGSLNTISREQPCNDLDIRLLDSLKWEIRMLKPLVFVGFPILPWQVSLFLG